MTARLWLRAKQGYKTVASRLQPILEQPIPALERASNVRPVLENGEPLVDIARYGIAGKYADDSGPLLVRQTIAERLQQINYVLATYSGVEAFFGRPVEVFVSQGWSNDESFSTGGFIIVELRYATATRGYDAHCRMVVKGVAGERNLRASYSIMRGALLGKDSGLITDGKDMKSWSYGDQRWAAITHAPIAFYGPTKPVI